MVDKLLRQPKEDILAGVAQRLPHALHPNLITLIGFVVGIGATWVIVQRWYALGIALWLLNRLLDGLDGTVARVTQRQSDLGGYLDILLDTVMYAAIPAALAISIGTSAAYLSLILLLTGFYVNAASWMYLAALLEKRQSGANARGELTSITMPDGILGGTETVLFFVLFLLFPAAQVALFGIMTVLTVATILHRFRWAARVL